MTTASAKTSGGHDALDQKRAPRQDRERREPSAVDRWVVLVLHRDAVIRRLRVRLCATHCRKRKFQAERGNRNARARLPLP